MKSSRPTLAIAILASLTITGIAREKTTPAAKQGKISMEFWTAEGERAGKIPPTEADVPYGKDKLAGLREYLPAGISVVSINYRFITQAHAAGVKPPVKWPLEDAARALQFVRSKAAEWNIDKTRIGASGGSAGACSSLWLAFHDDMADPESSDPIARESTRLICAGVVGAQTSLDPAQMKEWISNINYGNQAFGFMGTKGDKNSGFREFHQNREKIMPWIKDYSPYEWVSSDDPPVYLHYSDAPAIGKKRGNATHSSNFGVKLQEKMKSVGVECQLMHVGAPAPEFEDPVDFLIARLKAKPNPR